MTRLAFIGAGNMARAIVGGLIDAGGVSIVCADPVAEQRTALATLGAETTTDNTAAVTGADAVVLAVKPQVLPEVCRALAPALADARPLVVSIAAGVPLSVLAACCGQTLPIVRCMPNTPALIGHGITALYANSRASGEQRALAERILGATGAALWVDSEAELDAVTAVSGSGPAYVFALIEAMEHAGVALGLPEQTARQLAVATAEGAGALAAGSSESPAVLRERVTSPGGTTAAALAVFAERDFGGLVAAAIRAAHARSAELGREAAAAADPNNHPSTEA